MAVISFMRLQEERLNHEARRTRVAPRPTTPKLSAHHTISQVPAPKKLELWERSAKGLCWHCDELWSRKHRCKKRRLLVIELMEEAVLQHLKESLDHEDKDVEEEAQPINCMVYVLINYVNPQTMKVGGFLKQQSITILIDTGSTNNFLNSKVVARMVLHIEDCSKFDVEITDSRILKCDQRCPQVKLLLQNQEIITNFFLFLIDDYEAVLGIEWLTMLGDVS
ncbi:hypothetical protein BHE74_00042213 [Ensete ventricosum]|nr:hypothetical protein BHE74_00042213 [Ensete ventricosum]